MIDIAVIDDHPAILAGVQAWCAGADPPIAVLAAGDDVDLAWTQPGARARIVILDLHVGGPDPAYSVLRRLVDAGRQVIVYSMRNDTATPVECLELGAFTYLNKAEGPDHLVAAVHAADADLPYVSPSLAGAIGVDRSPARPKLTPREVDVLLEWFKCESKQLAADRLGLSPRTIASYVDRVRIKYANTGRSAPTKATLLARAIEDGLIRADEL